MTPRVAVTGWAWRTPLGGDVDGVLDRLCAGERAARPNPRFDARTYVCRLAATVAAEPRPSKHRRFLRRMGLLGAEVGADALAHAGVPGGERLGLFFGFGGLRAYWSELMPALAAQEPDAADAWARGLARLHPFWMLHHLSNNAHALLAIDVGGKGEGVTFGGASAGAQALAAAAQALADGTIDAALVVAYDSLVEPETITEMAARGAATCASASPPAPYGTDPAFEGVVPGEAAAAVVLERSGAGPRPVLAHVRAADAADGQPGEPRSATLGATIARVGAADTPVGWVDGAARARRTLDDDERRLVLLSGLPDATPLTATASALGYLGAAMPVVQVIALGRLLGRKVVCPIAGLTHAAAGPLVPVAGAPQPASARAALGLATGAPGLASAVLVEVP